MMVESQREVVGKPLTIERRYFISSLAAEAPQSLQAVRGHWAIENSLHWVLDIAFREDECRIRAENSAENMAILRQGKRIINPFVFEVFTRKPVKESIK